jgi:hypothetical protein
MYIVFGNVCAACRGAHTLNLLTAAPDQNNLLLVEELNCSSCESRSLLPDHTARAPAAIMELELHRLDLLQTSAAAAGTLLVRHC